MERDNSLIMETEGNPFGVGLGEVVWCGVVWYESGRHDSGSPLLKTHCRTLEKN